MEKIRKSRIHDIKKYSNILPIWGNDKSMNLNHLILANIQASHYFKSNLIEMKTFFEVVDEIFYHVSHLEPWEKGSRKTAGQTGMCGGVRGVGAGGVVSSCFCILFKLFAMRITRRQLITLINHKDSPYIRGIGFMFIRYCQPPADLWDWFEPYFDDPEEIDVKAGGGSLMTIGEMLHSFLTKLEWFATLFPRIPVPVQQQIMEHMKCKPLNIARVNRPEGEETVDGDRGDEARDRNRDSSRDRRSRDRSRERRHRSASRERHHKDRSGRRHRNHDSTTRDEKNRHRSGSRGRQGSRRNESRNERITRSRSSHKRHPSRSDKPEKGSVLNKPPSPAHRTQHHHDKDTRPKSLQPPKVDDAPLSRTCDAKEVRSKPNLREERELSPLSALKFLLASKQDSVITAPKSDQMLPRSTTIDKTVVNGVPKTGKFDLKKIHTPKTPDPSRKATVGVGVGDAGKNGGQSDGKKEKKKKGKKEKKRKDGAKEVRGVVEAGDAAVDAKEKEKKEKKKKLKKEKKDKKTKKGDKGKTKKKGAPIDSLSTDHPDTTALHSLEINATTDSNTIDPISTTISTSQSIALQGRSTLLVGSRELHDLSNVGDVEAVLLSLLNAVENDSRTSVERAQI